MLPLRFGCLAALLCFVLSRSVDAEEPSGRGYGALGGSSKFDGPDPERTNFIYLMPVLDLGYRGAFTETSSLRLGAHVSGAYGPFGNGDDSGGDALEMGVGGDLGMQSGRVLFGVRVDGGFGQYRYTFNYAGDLPRLYAFWVEPKIFGSFDLMSSGAWALRIETGPRWRFYRGRIAATSGPAKGPSHESSGRADGAMLGLALELRF